MERTEKALRILLQVVGVIVLTAVLAIVMPTPWMDSIHRWLGLGELPRAPIVEYLTRSLSLMYALFGALMLYMARDVRRYAPLLVFFAAVSVAAGVVLLGIDIYAGLPLDWILSEGPGAVVLSLVILVLARRVAKLPLDSGVRVVESS